MICTNCHREIHDAGEYSIVLVTSDDDDRACYGDALSLDQVGRIGHVPATETANLTDDQLIVTLGLAEAALDNGMTDAEYGDVIRAVVARFGEESMDRLSEYWTTMHATPDEICAAETSDPARFVRLARGF